MLRWMLRCCAGGEPYRPRAWLRSAAGGVRAGRSVLEALGMHPYEADLRARLQAAEVRADEAEGRLRKEEAKRPEWRRRKWPRRRWQAHT